jgi:hypothetical protein
MYPAYASHLVFSTSDVEASGWRFTCRNKKSCVQLRVSAGEMFRLRKADFVGASFLRGKDNVKGEYQRDIANVVSSKTSFFWRGVVEVKHSHNQLPDSRVPKQSGSKIVCAQANMQLLH